MKKTITLFVTLLLTITTWGAVDKNVFNSIVSIATTDINGKPLGKALGFVISTDSTAQGETTVLAPYGVFKHATKAVVTDSKGKTYEAHRILGANDLYDIVKFSVKSLSTKPLSIAASKLANNDKVSVLTGITNKKKPFTELSVTQTDEHGGLNYYTLSHNADSTLVGTPVFNTSGQVAGIIQKSARNETDKLFAVGIEISSALEVSTMSAANPSLNAIYIPKQLPSNEKQAASYLYLITKNSEDTISYLANLQDYISSYPKSTFGYVQRALYYASTKQYAKADADYQAALNQCDDKADVHYNMSTTLYHLNQDKAYKPYKDWTLERALNEVNEAYSILNTPLYLMQKGKCLYAMKKFQEAYDTYNEINKTKFRSSENLFYQSRSLEMAGGDSTKILALLDSAVARFKQPYKPDAAPYIYYRAQQYDRFGHYKEAVFGYRDYQDIVGTNNLNDRFFYLKEQAEVKSNFYPQALVDIERAITLNPNEYVYYIEKALIETRTGSYEEAVISAKQAQKIDNTDPDSYKLMGIAYGELGNTAEARKNLQRAVELGDTEAQSWLDSMKSTPAAKGAKRGKTR